MYCRSGFFFFRYKGSKKQYIANRTQLQGERATTQSCIYQHPCPKPILIQNSLACLAEDYKPSLWILQSIFHLLQWKIWLMLPKWHVERLQLRCFLGSTTGENQPSREVHIIQSQNKIHTAMPIKATKREQLVESSSGFFHLTFSV